MKLLIAGGGTGGHVYPALSVVEALLADDRWSVAGKDIAWIGGPASIEQQVLANERLAFHPISAGALRGMTPWGILKGLAHLLRGYAQARELVAELRPDVVLATGGYVSVPLVLAASAAGCPSLVYLPDMRPGLAVRSLSIVARRVAVSFESVADHFSSDKVIVSGYPVRKALYTTDRAEARARLGLNGGPTLLVMGGSRGAHSINVAVRGELRRLLAMAQVLHISGHSDYAELRAVRDALEEPIRSRYHLHAYLHGQMADALVASDLALARAGASTLGEFPAVGLPSVLVPYPYAGQHQQLNAEYLAEHGAAIIVPDAELGDRMIPVIAGLFDEPDRLASMQRASRKLAVPCAARTIAAALIALARSDGNG